MKIVVIGGTGLVGSTLVVLLTERGHTAVAAAPSTGVNSYTGEGLGQALEGVEVVVDVSNSPQLDDSARDFFRVATGKLLAAETRAGVGHHVVLSVVGTDRLAPQSGYFQAKLEQEQLIAAGPIPYTIVHATQFFEFVATLADSATVDGEVRMPPALFQPMAAADVAAGVAEAATGEPVNGAIEIAGPEAPDLLGDLPELEVGRLSDSAARLRDTSPLRGEHTMTCAPMTRTPTSDTDVTARFAREVEPHLEVLTRAARRRTLCRADADDLLQDTLLRAFVGFETFRPGTNLRAWLFRIMHNQWISGQRAKQARIQEVWIGTDDHGPAAQPQRYSGGARSAEAEFLEMMPDAKVRAALAALPDGFAEVVFYADVEGYTYAEIASILALPAGTVMSRIYRARIRLRLALAALAPSDAATDERISA